MAGPPRPFGKQRNLVPLPPRTVMHTHFLLLSYYGICHLPWIFLWELAKDERDTGTSSECKRPTLNTEQGVPRAEAALVQLQHYPILLSTGRGLGRLLTFDLVCKSACCSTLEFPNPGPLSPQKAVQESEALAQV